MIAVFILPDFPSTTRWLTPEEKELALARISCDGIGHDDQDIHASHAACLKACFEDWRIYVRPFSFGCANHQVFIGLYVMATGALTITYFIPVLVGSLGYSGSAIQYMTVPICKGIVYCLKLADLQTPYVLSVSSSFVSIPTIVGNVVCTSRRALVSPRHLSP